jgi:hypothetical protein
MFRLSPAAVKKHWMEDKIWNSQWGKLLGMTWVHADLYDRQPETPDGAKEDRGKSPSPPEAVGNGAQRLHLPSSRPFNKEATPGADINLTDGNDFPPAPTGVDTYSSETSRLAGMKKTESTILLRSHFGLTSETVGMEQQHVGYSISEQDLI